MLILGILTFFLLPFVQLFSVQVVPLFASDTHRRAAACLDNLLAEAMARPWADLLPTTPFVPIASGSDFGLEGRVEVGPHPDLDGLTVIRAQVRWGWLFLRKTLSLEAAVSQTRP